MLRCACFHRLVLFPCGSFAVLVVCGSLWVGRGDSSLCGRNTCQACSSTRRRTRRRGHMASPREHRRLASRRLRSEGTGLRPESTDGWSAGYAAKMRRAAPRGHRRLTRTLRPRRGGLRPEGTGSGTAGCVPQAYEGLRPEGGTAWLFQRSVSTKRHMRIRSLGDLCGSGGGSAFEKRTTAQDPSKRACVALPEY